jgi:hypothetical protein
MNVMEQRCCSRESTVMGRQITVMEAQVKEAKVMESWNLGDRAVYQQRVMDQS